MALKTGLKAGLNSMRWLAAAAGLSLLLAVTGCGAFFQCEGKTDCGTGSTATGTGDYAYVSNSATGSEYIDGYTVGTGTLTAITGSPFDLGYVPVAMAVSSNDGFLYVSAAAGTASTGLYLYTISSTGAVTGGTELITNTEIDSLVVSPDGNFLFTVGPNSLGVEALTEYALNTSTGDIAGSGGTSFALPENTNCSLVLEATPVSQACSVAVSPSEDFVGVSVGGEGTLIFPYTSSSGITTTSYSAYIAPVSDVSGDYSLAFDESGYLYIARTAELSSYGSLSTASPVNVNNVLYSSSATPRGVTLSTTFGYVYTADEGTSQVSAFSVATGVPTQLSTSPQLGPNAVSALGVDRSGTYLLAAGYNATNGLQMFTTSSNGLTAVTSQGTGAATTIPVVMALTH